MKSIRRLTAFLSLAGLVWSSSYMLYLNSSFSFASLWSFAVAIWILSPFIAGSVLFYCAPETYWEFNIASLALVTTALGLWLLFSAYQRNNDEPIFGFGILAAPVYSFAAALVVFTLIFFWRRRSQFKLDQ